MADPITIIGCVGAICNIIDATGKAISTLNGLRNRWATADITLLTLATQLMALRAALSKIQALMEDSYASVLHYQLIMDLEQSVECCKLLISALGKILSDLDACGDRPLDFAHRLKVAFGHNKVDDIEKLLQHQTSALTLLLTALSCTTLFEQKRSIKKLHSSRGIKRAKYDSASLTGLRDSSSFASKWSDTLSKFSLEFEFDPVIFSSDVYQRAFRKSLKQAWTQQPRPSVPKPLSACKILLLGDDETGKDELVNQIHKTRLLQCTEEEISTCRLPRLKACLEHTKLLIRTMDQQAGHFDSTRYMQEDLAATFQLVRHVVIAIDGAQHDLILTRALELLRILATAMPPQADPTPSITILFRNLDTFEARLHVNPLKECVPGYDGPNSIEGFRNHLEINCRKFYHEGFFLHFVALRCMEVTDLVRLTEGYKYAKRANMMKDSGFV
ncbi:Guanine nucleotide-binding protein alpha-2 subunit [Neocucurbitaria cava]|uniref:Guanine nucleotide-binding protein alpha-2 subunit n=1 Tax=Neocucurbitaria cava TaxID=798079 RepID=A0A9W8Y730_9PLEO|nr:Guanine nucleotide-binding protein alpha-2 subunit [Neocucurbitaria cava]